MKNQRPDGQTVRDLLEATLERSLGGNRAVPVQRSDAGNSPLVVGEILDTHHPHLPGRVLVRWWATPEKDESAWLHHERHLRLRRGDRVLVTLPVGWSEWVVTGALTQTPATEAPTPPAEGAKSATPATTTLQLEPGEALLVRGHDGAPLLRVHQGPDGPVLELQRDQVEIRARRTLRLAADTVEIVGGQGGVDIRTDGDAVVRAHAIKLN